LSAQSEYAFARAHNLWGDGVGSPKSPSHVPVWATIVAVAAVGVTFIFGSRLLGPHNPFPWADLIRDFGMVLAPMSVMSAIYEYTLRRDFERHLKELARGFSVLTPVFREDRRSTIRSVIENARDELIMSGLTPLLDFYGEEAWLIEKFKNIRHVRISCLESTSPYVDTRSKQSGSAPIKAEIELHDRLLSNLQKDLANEIRNGSVAFSRFNLPPAELFYIADRTVLLATWYPYERGENSPCVLAENVQNGEYSRRFLQYFLRSFEQLSEEPAVGDHAGKALD
jgi:hypothetical protein